MSTLFGEKNISSTWPKKVPARSPCSPWTTVCFRGAELDGGDASRRHLARFGDGYQRIACAAHDGSREKCAKLMWTERSFYRPFRPGLAMESLQREPGLLATLLWCSTVLQLCMSCALLIERHSLLTHYMPSVSDACHYLTTTYRERSCNLINL